MASNTGGGDSALQVAQGKINVMTSNGGKSRRAAEIKNKT